MKILVIGSGGREHALVWKIAQSPKVTSLFCAPGNPGIAQLATCIPVAVDDISALLSFARNEKIDLTVVGPEAPLVKGIVDLFEKNGLRIFGASRKAAEIEASKSFAKKLMAAYGIPTATGKSFGSLAPAQKYIRQIGAPLVVKADGLAAGKGVYVCMSEEEALSALQRIMKDRLFGQAGDKVLIEEYIEGEEASFLALTDGKTVLPLPTCQDHKAIYDGDKGPNTGGMGAYSPAPIVTATLHEKIMRDIMLPAVKGMAAEGRPYKGVLYAGLMIAKDRIKVLEFNARFGDPEAQPLLMRIQNDLVPLMEAVVEERLGEYTIDVDPRAAVCVVMASGGYPEKYQKNLPIHGLAGAARMRDVMVFHAGTSEKNNQVVATGGRVLGVTAMGETVAAAIDTAYQAVAKISWETVHFRKDIGQKALKRLSRKPLVGIVMGSDSDAPIMEEAAAILKKFDIPYQMTVASAHRSPLRASEFASTARDRGIRVIIAGAGLAAHLAGSLAAHTTLPVIGVPIDAGPLQGLDSLLSTVQMPPGIPVATVAIGKVGARNAGLLAVQMLALCDPDLSDMLTTFKQEMAVEVEKKAARFERQGY
ncbi:MAG: phosphoribosylamine--glycine ligase [Thermodesulfobacteriota bacterium]